MRALFVRLNCHAQFRSLYPIFRRYCPFFTLASVYTFMALREDIRYSKQRIRGNLGEIREDVSENGDDLQKIGAFTQGGVLALKFHLGSYLTAALQDRVCGQDFFVLPQPPVKDWSRTLAHRRSAS